MSLLNDPIEQCLNCHVFNIERNRHLRINASHHEITKVDRHRNAAQFLNGVQNLNQRHFFDVQFGLRFQLLLKSRSRFRRGFIGGRIVSWLLYRLINRRCRRIN